MIASYDTRLPILCRAATVLTHMFFMTCDFYLDSHLTFTTAPAAPSSQSHQSGSTLSCASLSQLQVQPPVKSYSTSRGRWTSDIYLTLPILPPSRKEQDTTFLFLLPGRRTDRHPFVSTSTDHDTRLLRPQPALAATSTPDCHSAFALNAHLQTRPARRRCRTHILPPPTSLAFRQ